ncbi:MAG: ribosome silencing factor [Alphaproteobacteria bacterium]|nr:ribosome silencing factor [Alphaproteobacteria bacterium]
MTAQSLPASFDLGAYDAQCITVFKRVFASLEDDQASDIVVLPIGEHSDIADIMLVASGRVARHVAAITDHMIDSLRAIGVRPIGVSGLPSADWVVVDLGNIIVHVFRPEVRAYYDLESLWSAPGPASAPHPASNPDSNPERIGDEGEGQPEGENTPLAP